MGKYSKSIKSVQPGKVFELAELYELHTCTLKLTVCSNKSTESTENQCIKISHRKQVAQISEETDKGNNCLKKGQIKCLRHSQDTSTKW